MAREQKLSLATEDNDKPQALQEANSTFFERLKKLFQSGHINFLIGSGASMPAIRSMDNTEQVLSNLYDVIYSQQTTAEEISNAKAQASQKESAFKATLKPAKDALINGTEILDDKEKDKVKPVLTSYSVL
jgi:hypothetical protein